MVIFGVEVLGLPGLATAARLYSMPSPTILTETMQPSPLRSSIELENLGRSSLRILLRSTCKKLNVMLPVILLLSELVLHLLRFGRSNRDVTTEEPGVLDGSVGHVLITNEVDKNGVRITGSPCGCGGIAYVGVFPYSPDLYYSPALVFNTGLNSVSEAISHEFGHNLGTEEKRKGYVQL